MDFAKADFIEPAGKARDRRRIANDDASIALQIGDVGILNWEEIESEKRFEQRHIVAGDDGGFDVPPTVRIDFSNVVWNRRVTMKEIVEITSLIGVFDAQPKGQFPQADTARPMLG